MIVICEFDSNTEVPELITKYGYEPDSVLHITKGKEYRVYGMISWIVGRSETPSLHYIIRDDLSGISTYNAMLFKIVNSKLSTVDWHFDFKKGRMAFIDFILGYDEFVNNEGHYNSALLGDEPGCSALSKWCDLIDNLEKAT